MKSYLALVLSALLASAVNAAPVSITIATPGPGNLLHLPIDLIPRIGADAAEGAKLNIRYFGGEPVAYRDMLDQNSDFAVAGIAALADLKAHGEAVQSLAAITTTGAYVMLVRSDLSSQVKTLADLKGRVTGVNTSSIKSKSTSQMTAEYLLTRNGVSLDSVHFVAAGQSFDDQKAALASERVDALMGDEPFASKLISQGTAYSLVNLMDANEAKQWLGGSLLNAQLCSRSDTVTTNPERTELMVRILKRTLTWIKEHSSDDIASALGYKGEDKAMLVSLLNRYKDAYSATGAFSDQEVDNTQAFFHSVNKARTDSEQLKFDSFINSRWSGIKP